MSHFAERIPLIKIDDNGSFKPRSSDLDSGIDHCLRENATPVFRAHGIRLLSLEPTSKHTSQGFHTVLWLDRGRYRKPQPWRGEDVKYVAENTIFWREFERYLAFLRQDHPNMWCYMSLGFFDPAQEVPEGAYHAGMQSQRRLHIHLVDPIINASDFPNASDVPLWQLSYSLNIAGELTYRQLATDSRLAQFGSPFTFKQKFGDGSNSDDFSFYRRMLGFEDVHQAFRGVTQAQQAFVHDWCEVTKAIASQSYQMNGYALPLIQAACPGFGLILPSENDRRNGSVQENFGAWVIPFYVSGMPQILTPGGVVLKR